MIEHPPGDETQWYWLELPSPPASWGWGKGADLLVGSLAGPPGTGQNPPSQRSGNTKGGTGSTAFRRPTAGGVVLSYFSAMSVDKADAVAGLDKEIRKVRAGLRTAGVPLKLLDSIKTKAQMSGRRTTGKFSGNRRPRWILTKDDPYFGTEADCKVIHLQLLGMLCEFANAPVPDAETTTVLAKYIGHQPIAGTYRDALTKEKLDYEEFEQEALTPLHGHSAFHIGHENPTISPKHVPSNVSWRGMRSNLIQGDMTLQEARTKFVELIGRYFELGEVAINPE
jgi:hypothetical protein